MGNDTAPDNDAPAARSAPRWRKLWPLAIVLVGMIGFYVSGAADMVSLSTIIMERDALSGYVESHLIASLCAYVCIYAALVALSFPGASLITIVGGFVFGALIGTVLTVLAATLGATLIFLAAKSSLGGALRQRVGGMAERLAGGFEDNAFSYLLFLRLVPVFPFWLINIAPAMFAVPLRAYVAATAIGIIPGTFAYSLLGESLDSLIAAQEKVNPGCAAAGTCELDFGQVITPQLIAAIIALCAAALLPIAIKRLRRSREGTA